MRRWRAVIRALARLRATGWIARCIDPYVNNRFNDIPSGLDSARGQYAPVTDDAWARIIRYRPRHATPNQWAAVQPLVVSVVTRMNPRTPDVTRRLLNMVGLFSVWVWARTGKAPTVADYFTAPLIERFVAHGLVDTTPARKWDVRRQLATIAEQCAGVRMSRELAPFGKGNGRIFTDDEIARIVSWASTLSTEVKQRNACALVALAAGAGLRTHEITDLQVEDIERTDEGLMLISVRGDRARRVPVRNVWIRLLGAALEGRTEGPVITGYRWPENPAQLVQRFLTENAGSLRPTVSTLRRGYVVSLLEAGIPEKVVNQVCGYPAAHNFDFYEPYLRAERAEDYFARIAGIGGTR